MNAHPEENHKLREKMIQDQLISRGISDPAVLEAFRTVDRRDFVPAAQQTDAYSDHPIPIGQGQTVSQPYIVALMTEKLQPRNAAKVLEIGTGSGYQTAILAQLAQKVYTIERLPEFAHAAKQRLDALGYTNIYYTARDGSLGWPEEAPFDRIIVTAAAPEIPAPLAEQLAEGGRMVLPAGNMFEQELILAKKENGQLTTESICRCMFVRLIGEAAWK